MNARLGNPPSLDFSPLAAGPGEICLSGALAEYSRRIITWLRCCVGAACVWFFAAHAAASDYYSHVIFDNSVTGDSYYYSGGSATQPSTLQLSAGLLPVETKNFLSPPNAIRLEWRSGVNGSWHGEIRVVDIRNRRRDFQGDAFYFWCFAPKVIAASALPLIQLDDNDGGFSVAIPLRKIVADLPPGRWTQVRIPLTQFVTKSFHPFDPRNVHSVFFVQSAADDVPHTLIIDEIKIDSQASSSTPVLPVPQGVRAVRYDPHG